MVRDHGPIHAKEFGDLCLLLSIVHFLLDEHRQLTRFQILPLQVLDDLLVVGMRSIDKCRDCGFPNCF